MEALNAIFYCPITGDLMNDPVIDKDGITYEREAIESWIKLKGTSPTTRTAMTIQDLTPNRSLRNAIEEIKKAKCNYVQNIGSITNDAQSLITPTYSVNVNLSYYNLKDASFPVVPSLANSDYDEYIVGIAVESPDDNTPDHVPSDIVLIIDTSGSMGNSASLPGNNSGENSAMSELTLLDLVKHATKTIIQTLNQKDRLALVTFSDEGILVFDFISMSELGKTVATSRLQTLEADGMTNIWDGLNKGIQLLNNSAESGIKKRNTALFLLTDGEPNVEPPRGTLAMLQKLKEKGNGQLNCVIHSFGFGYSLDSPLLKGIAIEGNGMYSFIPDSGFVGTVFVNALANTLNSAVEDTSLTVLAASNVRMVTALSWLENPELHSIKALQPALHKVVEVGSIRLGQPVNRLLYMAVPKGYRGPFFRITIENNNIKARSARVLYASNIGELSDMTAVISSLPTIGSHPIDLHEVKDTTSIDYHVIRLKSLLILEEVFKRAAEKKLDLASAVLQEHMMWLLSYITHFETHVATAVVTQTASEPSITAGSGATSAEDEDFVMLEVEPTSNSNAGQRKSICMIKNIKGILADFSGQISEAVSKNTWFNKWGRHYLPSLRRAHELQICNNFKDPGVQFYAGSKFTQIRDAADDIFCALPPPVKYEVNNTGRSIVSSAMLSHSNFSPASMAPFAVASAPPYPAQSMSMYLDRDAGCFHGDCTVILLNRKTRCVKDLKKYDVIRTNAESKEFGRIVCIVETVLNSAGLNMVVFPNGLSLTAYHPIKCHGQWLFPINAPEGKTQGVETDRIYSVLLEKLDKTGFMETVWINGYNCATLAHGVVNDDVASHTFFGTDRCVKSLKKCRRYPTGRVRLAEGWMIRDCESGQVCDVDTRKELL